MNLNEAKQILKENGYICEGFGDFMGRVFKGETRLSQALAKETDKTVKYFASLIAGGLSGPGQKMENEETFVNALLDDCDELVEGMRKIASKYPKNNGIGVQKLYNFISGKMNEMYHEYKQMDNLIKFKKVFSSYPGDQLYRHWADEYSKRWGYEKKQDDADSELDAKIAKMMNNNIKV